MIKKEYFIIVDDDTTNHLICEFTIKRYNPVAKIEPFTDPEKALTYIENRFKYAGDSCEIIVFLDINLGTMTAWEFLDLFNNFNHSIKDNFSIYLLSAAIEDFEKELKKHPYVKGIFCKPLILSYLNQVQNYII